MLRTICVVIVGLTLIGCADQPVDEAAFIEAAQVAVGGAANLSLSSGDGSLTEPGESALEYGYLACDMSVEELHEQFHSDWPQWRGPTDTPDQMHRAAGEHLCR